LLDHPFAMFWRCGPGHVRIIAFTSEATHCDRWITGERIAVAGGQIWKSPSAVHGAANSRALYGA
ncbi:hypothetical protein ACFVHQ_22735, partial [Actinomycetes bacterium NPDC127524]